MADALMVLCGVNRNPVTFGPLYVVKKLITNEKRQSIKYLTESELLNYGLAEHVRNLMTKIHSRDCEIF